jgi:pimeloyl-ACP methyl ester carboxylesterase
MQLPSSARVHSVALLAAALLAACTPRVSVMQQPATAESTVSVNGLRLAYATHGPAEGAPMLLLAGTGMQLIDWPPELVAELVRRGYRVIVYDHRDMGHSSKFTTSGLPDTAAIGAALRAGKPAPLAYGLRDMARDAVGLLDALGVARAHLVGVSMGGDIAQYVAIDHPERVASLTLIGSDNGNPTLPVIAQPAAFSALPPPPSPGDTAAYIEYNTRARLVLAGPRDDADEATVRAQVRRDVERDYDPAALQRQQTAVVVDRFEPGQYRSSHLARITAPTVVLQGADDPLQPVQAARDIAARVPDAELRIVPGMGHDLSVPLVGVVADAISAAVSRATEAR